MSTDLEEGVKAQVKAVALDAGGVELGIAPRGRSQSSVSQVDAAHSAVVSAVLPLQVKKKDLGRWAELRKDFAAAVGSFKGLVNLSYMEPDDVLVAKAGAEDTLELSVVIKMDSYKHLQAWITSEERAKLVKRALDEKIVHENKSATEVDTLWNIAMDGPLQISKPSIVQRAGNPPPPRRPPAKYKLFAVIFTAVYPCVLMNSYAGTANAIADKTGGDPWFGIYVMLYQVVFVVVYCFVPLLMQFVFGKWVATPTPVPSWEPARTLHLGFDLFKPPAKPVDLAPRVERLEGHLEALKKLCAQQHRDLAQVKSQQGDSGGSSAVMPAIAASVLAAAAAEKEEGGEEHGSGVRMVQHVHVEWVYSGQYFLDWMAALNSAMQKHMETEGQRGDGDFEGINYVNEGGNQFALVLHYPSKALMQSWADSGECKALMQELATMLVQGDDNRLTIGTIGNDKHGSVIRDIFSDVHLASDAPIRSQPPPVWKTTFLTIQGLFLCIFTSFSHLPDQLAESGIKAVSSRGERIAGGMEGSVFIMVAFNVFATVYLGAPFFTFFFDNWLGLKYVPPKNKLLHALTMGIPTVGARAMLLAFYVLMLILAIFEVYPNDYAFLKAF